MVEVFAREPRDPGEGISPVLGYSISEAVYVGRTCWRVCGTQGAAQTLGLKPTTLEARMKKLGIKRPS